MGHKSTCCPLLRETEKITVGSAAFIQLQNVADDEGVVLWGFRFFFPRCGTSRSMVRRDLLQ